MTRAELPKKRQKLPQTKLQHKPKTPFGWAVIGRETAGPDAHGEWLEHVSISSNRGGMKLD